MTPDQAFRVARTAALLGLLLLAARFLLGCATGPANGVYGRPGDTSYQLYQDIQRERYLRRLRQQLNPYR